MVVYYFKKMSVLEIYNVAQSRNQWSGKTQSPPPPHVSKNVSFIFYVLSIN